VLVTVLLGEQEPAKDQVMLKGLTKEGKDDDGEMVHIDKEQLVFRDDLVKEIRTRLSVAEA